MSEVMDLTVIEIKQEQAPALYSPNGLEDYLNHIREMAKEAPDVSTQKGRDRIGSLARAIGSSKKAIEEPGRAYLKRLKEAVKPAEAELKRFVDECDAIRDSILKPRAEWEAEQARIKAEEAMNAMHAEALDMDVEFDARRAEKIAADHELALLMNEQHDREVAERKAEVERQRIAHEEELKRQAAEKARRELEEKAERERAESARREAELKLKAEQAEREKKELAEKAERDRIEAEQRAEREKQAAIEETKRKAQAEADRIRREAEVAEAARIAEQKRTADEAAARAANEKHRRAIGAAVVKALTEHTSISREQAIEVLTALKDGLIPNSGIHY
ncbi:hypothetical protein PUATCC27989T_00443 [Phytobacter ursingii]|nr:hypothetical protein PUATCC27989T_00443 [Phytobacter ursingii]